MEHASFKIFLTGRVEELPNNKMCELDKARNLLKSSSATLSGHQPSRSWEKILSKIQAERAVACKERCWRENIQKVADKQELTPPATLTDCSRKYSTLCRITRKKRRRAALFHHNYKYWSFSNYDSNGYSADYEMGKHNNKPERV